MNTHNNMISVFFGVVRCVSTDFVWTATDGLLGWRFLSKGEVSKSNSVALVFSKPRHLGWLLRFESGGLKKIVSTHFQCSFCNGFCTVGSLGNIYYSNDHAQHTLFSLCCCFPPSFTLALMNTPQIIQTSNEQQNKYCYSIPFHRDHNSCFFCCVLPAYRSSSSTAKLQHTAKREIEKLAVLLFLLSVTAV